MNNAYLIKVTFVSKNPNKPQDPYTYTVMHGKNKTYGVNAIPYKSLACAVKRMHMVKNVLDTYKPWYTKVYNYTFEIQEA